MPGLKKYKKHLNKLHKKVSRTVIFIVILLVAIPFLFFLGSAQASSNWDLTGSYTSNVVCVPACSASYVSTMNINTMNLATGDFSGNGFDNGDNNIAWNVSGNVKDSDFTFHIIYTGSKSGYTIDGNGTISENGSLSGTAKNNYGVNFVFTTTSGNAKPVANNTKEDCKKEGWNILQSKTQGQCIKNFNQESKTSKEK